jgi:hypothetical protein
MHYQLAYCTNVHAGADLEHTTENLRRHALAVKQRFSPRDPMGIGLWLAAPAVRQLLSNRRLPELADRLAEWGLVPFTFNGFPQGDFHEKVVKHRVYQPTWWEDDRVEYTLDLITALDALLPTGMEGSISTLPIAWREPPPSQQHMEQAARNLDRVVQRLARLESETGRLIYVCLEPEPGCVLTCGRDVVTFLEDVLWPIRDRAEAQRYLRVCHDICHSAVMFENQHEVLTGYACRNIEVGKIQVSSAVRVNFDELHDADRRQARAALASFAEDRYLHQTCIRSGLTGEHRLYEDLSQIIQVPWMNDEWRVHFHVPIYLERFGQLLTTQDAIRQCLQGVDLHPALRHFEVETYAWSVLPQELRQPELADGIAAEMQWFVDEANSHGLAFR